MTEYIAIEDDNCHFPRFANWIKASWSFPNNAMVWLLRLFHLMPCDNFLSGNVNNKVLATYPCDLEDLTCIFDINECLGIYLTMVRKDVQDILHRCHICVEIRSGYVEDAGA